MNSKYHIEWSDKLSVGIASIDQQHKVLITIMNQVLLLIEKRDLEKLPEVFSRMHLYVKEYFGHEEALFIEHKWSGKESHIVQHQVLLYKLIQCESTFGGRLDFASLLNFASFLKTWILEHILVEDRNYVSFLQGKLGRETLKEN